MTAAVGIEIEIGSLERSGGVNIARAIQRDRIALRGAAGAENDCESVLTQRV